MSEESAGERITEFKVAQRPCADQEGTTEGVLATGTCGRCGAGIGQRKGFSEQKPGLSGQSVETTLSRE